MSLWRQPTGDGTALLLTRSGIISASRSVVIEVLQQKVFLASRGVLQKYEVVSQFLRYVRIQEKVGEKISSRNFDVLFLSEILHLLDTTEVLTMEGRTVTWQKNWEKAFKQSKTAVR